MKKRFSIFILSLIMFNLLNPVIASAQHSTIEISFPAASIAESIDCSEDFEKTLEITWRKRLFLVYVPALVNTPIVRGRAACRSFISAWQKTYNPADRVIFPLEVIQEEFDASAPVRYRVLSRTFHRKCKDLGFCSDAVLGSFSVQSELKKCQPQLSFQSWWNKMRPRFLKPEYKQISQVTVKAFPFQPLTEDLKEAALKNGNSAVFGATMSAGISSLYKLSNQLNSGTRPVFLALDAGALFAAREGAVLPNYFLNHPVLHAIPMTSGVYYKSIFHWKIISDLNAETGILSSMNMSNPLKTPFIDFSYEFSSQKVKRELRDHLYNAMLQQCDRISDFECLVDFSVHDAKLRKGAVEAARRGCHQLQKLNAPKSSPEKGYFMQPQDTEVEQLIIDLIGKAEKEVVVLSHKFTLRRVADALIKAKKRGVQIYVLTTRTPHLSNKLPSFFFYSDNQKKSLQMPEPHMKVMVVDRQKLFFGTGNFTQNAVRDARELFAVTEDSFAIQNILRVAASLLLGHLGFEAPTFGLSNSSEQWVIGSSGNINDENLISEKNPWMPHYRKVNQKGIQFLKECNLGHPLIVPLELYKECQEQNLP